MTRPVVIMGVSGCGKSTLGAALAASVGWPFIEGDTLHPRANVDKMAAGMPLDDRDRAPFLDRVADAIAGGRVVVSCSALRRRYRDRLRRRAGDVAFVLPVVPREELAARLAARPDHFMPASLLDSQLDALEWPDPDEAVVVIDGALPVAEQVRAVRLGLWPEGTMTRARTSDSE